MNTSEAVKRIHQLCQTEDVDFVQRTEALYSELDKISDDELLTHIEEGGMIPEDIAHDSSEEKLFAKYCDYLLARGLSLIGIPARPIAERSDAADVEGEGTVESPIVLEAGASKLHERSREYAVKPANRTYRIVGDAKAFRLSRTAKNQKDFKIDALDRWKKGAQYAVLLAPLYQYPTRTSQIYQQAVEKRVTLLSFTHLGFLLANSSAIDQAVLERVWHVYSELPRTKDAAAYWKTIDELVATATSKSVKELEDYKRSVLRKVHRRAEEQLAHWNDRRKAIEEMEVDRLRATLIRVERIESNIATISGFLRFLEGASHL